MIPINRVNLFNSLIEDDNGNFNSTKIRIILGDKFRIFQDICQFLNIYKDSVTNLNYDISDDEFSFSCVDNKGRRQVISSKKF